MSKKLLSILIIALCLGAVAAGIVLYKALVPNPELTEEQAVAIALEHAGVTARQVSYLNARLDRDDGVWVYEINFKQNDFGYDYEICINDDKILDHDKEYDD